MDRRLVAGIALLALAGGVAVVALFPGLLIGDPGEYNRTTVTASDANGTELATVEVRIADTTAKRYTGLSETDSLAADEGMLFVHEREENHSYVMRNMSFPLDIIFLDSEGTVVHIVHASVDGENAPYEARAKYVLEVNRGWTNQTGLSEGDRIAVPDHVQASG
jgi:uncharacterized membrane protein (UPF0127 family)